MKKYSLLKAIGIVVIIFMFLTWIIPTGKFVGGKVEAGESKEDALIRECREELAVTVSVGDVFMELTHEYPDLVVHLTLYHASISCGTLTCLEHNAMCWLHPNDIPNYCFCPADDLILQKIQEEYT